MAIDELFQHISVTNIQALIKPDNFSSIKLFENEGFKKVGFIPIIPNVLAVKYIYEKSS